MSTYTSFALGLGYRFNDVKDVIDTVSKLHPEVADCDEYDIYEWFNKRLPDYATVLYSAHCAYDDVYEICIVLKEYQTDIDSVDLGQLAVSSSMPVSFIMEHAQKMEALVKILNECGIADVPPLSVVPMYNVG